MSRLAKIIRAVICRFSLRFIVSFSRITLFYNKSEAALLTTVFRIHTLIFIRRNRYSHYLFPHLPKISRIKTYLDVLDFAAMILLQDLLIVFCMLFIHHS